MTLTPLFNFVRQFLKSINKEAKLVDNKEENFEKRETSENFQKQIKKRFFPFFYFSFVFVIEKSMRVFECHA